MERSLPSKSEPSLRSKPPSNAYSCSRDSGRPPRSNPPSLKPGMRASGDDSQLCSMTPAAAPSPSVTSNADHADTPRKPLLEFIASHHPGIREQRRRIWKQDPEGVI